ncbi:LptF/LptG family permease [Desulfurivibrio dismutans]|uniref:LptF/LptG family permease n=1 Tax=Desulfurivibrio dismutans TaxID=1398908 RepID=UPI0023DB7C57|nr:LptF/LptG family permease [Desulfurivibrio alkaliphilus]MDF1613541.1 LptF/LptG family permease [Desulfurivibrio alkaliphilus]
MKKIPLLLYTYLLTEMLAPFFAALLVINAILFLGRLIPLLDEIFGLGIGLADFIRICLYMSPRLLLFSLPMAGMMGVIIAFTRMNGDYEIMALKASGIGLYRMLPPVLLIGAVTALLTLVTATVLIPKSTIATSQLFWHLAKTKVEQGVRPNTFSEGLQQVVLYVEEVTPDNTWRGVYLSDLRDPDHPVTVMAPTGKLQADPAGRRIMLTLRDGTMHRDVEDKTQTLHFGRYHLEMPITPPAAFADRAGKNGMTQSELRQTAARLGPEHSRYKTYLIEYHQRLVLPAGAFILAVLGLTLTMLSRTPHQALGVPFGLLSFIAYYVLLTAAKTLAEGGQLPLAPAMWLPNLVFALFTVYLTQKTARELGNPWLERGLETGSRLIQRLRRPTMRTSP